jgi:quercetin dioxygenase-like cupin family protein
VVEDPVLKHRLSFSPSEDGSVRVEMWVDPGGGVPPHMHPAMEETFEVVSGRPSFLSGRRWQTAGPGETVTLAPGVRHAYRNQGHEVAHVICRAKPGLTLPEFLEDAAELNRAGKLNRHGLPRTPAGLIEGVRLAWRHRKMVIMRPV